MPTVPQINNPVTNKGYGNSLSTRQEGNIEPFDLEALYRPIEEQADSDMPMDNGQQLSMGRKELVPSTIQSPKDPILAVETLRNLINDDMLTSAKANGYVELYGELEKLVKNLYLTPGKLVGEILEQEKQNTSFSGNRFYDLIRELAKNGSNEMKDTIGSLLKSLNFTQNRIEILHALSANMKYLSDYFSPNEALAARLMSLSEEWGAKDASEYFELLKNDTLSLLKELSGSLLNDEHTQMIIPLITHTISRYNTNSYMLKENFALLQSQIPSFNLRADLDNCFRSVLSLILSPEEFKELNYASGPLVGNSLNGSNLQKVSNTAVLQQGGSTSLAEVDDEATNQIPQYLVEKLKDSQYIDKLSLEKFAIDPFMNSYNSGTVSGKKILEAIIDRFLVQPAAREFLSDELASRTSISSLIDYLNEILEAMPEFAARDEVYKAFAEIVERMTEKRELPLSSPRNGKGTDEEENPSTLTSLTNFIEKNINHTAIRSAESFNASNLLQSLLNAPGVFTPLSHYILPLHIEDTKAFGELWVDNDDKSTAGTGSKSKNYHLFLTFDVEALGRFEVNLYATGNNLSLSVLHPYNFNDKMPEILGNINKMIATTGYMATNVQTGILRTPHTLSEVFPRILEGRGRLHEKA